MDLQASLRNLTIVAGGPETVGPGGYLTGGGHGPLSATYGMGADQVLEMEIVTPGGEILTSNECQNQDLFWAMRGVSRFSSCQARKIMDSRLRTQNRGVDPLLGSSLRLPSKPIQPHHSLPPLSLSARIQLRTHTGAPLRIFSLNIQVSQRKELPVFLSFCRVLLTLT
jgi:hypothetical protein